jgi:hypothetical protein
MTRKMATVVVSVWMFLLVGQAFGASGKTVAQLLDQYGQAQTDSERISALETLSKTEPQTKEDANSLKAVLSQAKWNENLFLAAMKSVRKVKDSGLDGVLIDILKGDKDFLGKAVGGNPQGRSEQELKLRMLNAEFTIRKLGELKSSAAVPVLKEYLQIKGLNYAASEALAKIGGTDASEQIKEKAYKGEDVNYGGQGLQEALTIVSDLEDKSKKDQWPNIAKQIIHIRNPEAKESVKRLLNHEARYVRWEAAGKLRALADENDIPTIIEMTKNNDEIIRAESIHAMKKLKNVEFGDELIALLNDSADNVRRNAAKAIGYKKIARAVPNLEKAIQDSESRVSGAKVGKNVQQDELAVREECFIALYVLTDKKYDFKGKTARVESRAEKQKKSPSFF